MEWINYTELRVCVVFRNIDEYKSFYEKNTEIDLTNFLETAEYLLDTRWVFWIFLWNDWSQGYWDINWVPNSKKVFWMDFTS